MAEGLHHSVADQRARLAELVGEESVRAFASDPGRARDLDRLLLCSDVPLQVAARDPEGVSGLLVPGALERPHTAEQVAGRFERAVRDVDAADGVAGVLRRLRNRELLRIIWRDVSGRASLADTLLEMTQLAEAALRTALDWVYADCVRELGLPRGAASGEPQRLVVFALGKLGAGELNLSSDIDLVMAYPEAGRCDGPLRLTNQEFFIRVVQRLIAMLDEVSADGFVFRVDLRLRPYGEAGAIVLPFEVMDAYYQSQGRDWERYAFIKARAVAGDRLAGERWLASLQPFVYRRYLDFGAIEALREMKAAIKRERRGERAREDIKNGPGGIREIEFIAQVLQLIFGGAEPALRDPRLLPALDALAAAGHLEAQTARELGEAYTFLRTLEHRLQALRDAQTHSLPRDAEHRERIAAGLGFSDWQGFREALDQQRERVAGHFDAIVTLPTDEDDELQWLAELWADPDGEWAERLTALGTAEPERLLATLRELHDVRNREVRQEVGRRRLDRLMPLFLAEITRTSHPERAAERCARLLAAVARRTAYFAMLAERPAALRQLIRLAGESEWIAAELTRLPVLLDELLDPTLYSVPERDVLEAELESVLRRRGADDLEGVMDALRQFKAGHALRAAACQVAGVLELPKVSDYLTLVAEVILAQVLVLAWRYMLERHGPPAGCEETEPGMLIVGYGKLGGIELSPGSDLDIVMFHDSEPSGRSRGPRSLPNLAFFHRLAQRVIDLLTLQTTSGRLFELDMRLRPDGNAGPLVTPLTRLERYLEESAWTFEHQALVRARPVAGAAELARRFEVIRAEILSKPRDLQALRAEVLAMRERIHAQKGAAEADPKLAPGGIVDIEFMVQYLVLAWAHRHPELLRYTDNARILEAAAEVGVIHSDQARILIEGYYALRGEVHRMLLHSDLAPSDLRDVRRRIVAIWQEIFA